MISACHGALVALPFNAAATVKRQHRDGPTAGLSRDELWQGITGMMDECWRDWHRAGLPLSYECRLRDRFHYNEWTPQRLQAARNAFLAHESFERFASTLGTSNKRGFIVVNTADRKVMGELQMLSLSGQPHVCSPYDMVRPSERNKGLSYQFLLLGCKLGCRMNFTELHIGIQKTHTASNKRLVQAVEHGWAVQIHSTHDGHNYKIDLRNMQEAACR